MNVAELQVTDTSLFTEFLEKEQEIGILRIALAANGQIVSAQRLSKLELALRRVREGLVRLSESLQPTDVELLAAYEAVIDLIEIVDEILDRRGVSTTLPGSVPLVG
jgi:hypothetical protein